VDAEAVGIGSSGASQRRAMYSPALPDAVYAQLQRQAEMSKRFEIDSRAL
jgi:hypothetical protein